MQASNINLGIYLRMREFIRFWNYTVCVYVLWISAYMQHMYTCITSLLTKSHHVFCIYTILDVLYEIREHLFPLHLEWLKRKTLLECTTAIGPHQRCNSWLESLDFMLLKITFSTDKRHALSSALINTRRELDFEYKTAWQVEVLKLAARQKFACRCMEQQSTACNY